MFGYAAFLLDGDVGHGSGVGGAVKVVLAGGDENDITLNNGQGLVARANGAGAIGNDQDLVAGMLMELGPRTSIEGPDAEAEVAAVF